MFERKDLFDLFEGASVVVTGNTGFKGAWLTAWLQSMGAKVTGISKDIPTQPSLYNDLGVMNNVETNFIDINETHKIAEIFRLKKPNFIFHLAAQSIVSQGFKYPYETWRTNAMGTVSILEAITVSGIKNVNVVMITSDKVYKNREWEWGYRENDELGGSDPYGNSKVAAEMAITSYSNSEPFLSRNVQISSARAGNVIGGGDWAKGRIVPDAVRAWISQQPLELRNPHSTRPWQHVLEPISGYLSIASALAYSEIPTGESFNFGPIAVNPVSVATLISNISQNLDGLPELKWVTADQNLKEDNLLSLSSEKATQKLSWAPKLNFTEMISWIADWYTIYASGMDVTEITLKQIEEYKSGLVVRADL